MKNVAFALASMFILFAGTRADAGISFDLSSLPGSTITFTQELGGGLTHVRINRVANNPAKNSFSIDLVNGDFTSPSLGLEGNITGDGFTYKAIEIVTDGTKQTAALTSIGVNSFELIDAEGVKLTAIIQGVDITTDGTQGGTNSLGLINLSGIQYDGDNLDFKQLKQEMLSGAGIATIAFTFNNPAKSLSDLAVGSHSKGYAIAVSTVPEPGSMALAFSGLAMLGLGYYRRQRHKLV